MLKMAGAVAGGVLLLGAGVTRSACAMTDNVVVKAHVPFAFEVLGERMPAGDYEVKMLDVNQPGLLEIRSVRGDGPAALVITTPKDAVAIPGAEMRFDDVGRDKFLRTILLPDREGAQLPVSQAERVAARGVAAKAVKAHSHS